MRCVTLIVSSLLVWTVASGIGARPARAEYMAVKTHEVPVARLIANLEKKLGKDAAKAIAADAGKAPLAFDLARLHALAWATLKADVEVDDRRGEPWFGYEPPELPYAFRRENNAKRTPEIEAHLTEAIRLYRIGLTALPTEGARMGLAWCLAQQGGAARVEAIGLLRDIHEKAWTSDKDRQHWGMGEYGLAYEAGGYLVDLLDAKTDADEIAKIEARRKTISESPRKITPIVIPLRDDLSLSQVVDGGAGVAFDLDGSMTKKTWPWVAPGQGAWLVWDPTRAGRIDSGLELFGSVTFWVFWKDGYEALAALDDDGDGQLRGRELDGLALWKDDGDAASEPGEVVPLADAGIVALDTRADRSGDTPWSARGVTFADGRTRPTWDYIAR